MTVKYHIETPHGVVTRTTRGAKEAWYSHVVVYEGHIGVPGGKGSYKKIPTFHGRMDLAQSAAIVFEVGGGKARVYPITEQDYTIT